MNRKTFSHLGLLEGSEKERKRSGVFEEAGFKLDICKQHIFLLIILDVQVPQSVGRIYLAILSRGEV